MLSVTYKGIPGQVIAERSLEDNPVVMFIVQFGDGTIKQLAMYECEIHWVSMLDELKSRVDLEAA